MTKICSNIESDSQIRQPKLSNLELVAINFTAGYMSYNSELQLFRTTKGTELDEKIERSNALNPTQFSPVKRRKRKQIEILISQLE